MTAAFLLLTIIVVLSIFVGIGGILFLIGLFKNNRKLRSTGLIVALPTLVILIGCILYGSAKLLDKAKRIDPKQTWRSFIEILADDTGIQPADPEQAKAILSNILGNPKFLANTNVQGVWIEGIVLSYGYFTYTADERELLKVLVEAAAESAYGVESDGAPLVVAWDKEDSFLMYERGPQRNIPDWTPEAVTEKRCYEYLRFPWSHTILIDAKTGKIYHAITEIRD